MPDLGKLVVAAVRLEDVFVHGSMSKTQVKNNLKYEWSELYRAIETLIATIKEIDNEISKTAR